MLITPILSLSQFCHEISALNADYTLQLRLVHFFSFFTYGKEYLQKRMSETVILFGNCTGNSTASFRATKEPLFAWLIVFWSRMCIE